ncbi:MAG: hypothetical protein HQ546_05520, partial [Planctomycetes bacterium]|nr:hypothetical protein [Planctomycetota bacterium]
ARVDIYSLGFIAYEMLTGREFFGKLFSDVLCDGRSENLRWMKWHADAGLTVPELAEINELVPRGLSDIIAKMMAKDPNRRYATIDQVLADLRRISDLLGRPAGRIAAGLAVEQHAQPTVPVSAEVQVEEPPTAVVPKMPMSSKKKLVLSLSVGGLVVISALLLAGFVIGQRAKRADLARQAYEQARDRFAEASALYQDGELGDCQVAFEDAQARFERGDVDYSDVSGRSVQFAGYADMCRAWTAMIGGQWDKADHLCKQVVDTASGEMPGDLKGQIDWFKSLLPTRRSAAANLEAAEKAIAAKDIEDADREMAAYGRLTGPPADLNRWAVTLSEALAAAKIQLAFDRHMAAGDTARDSGEANLSAEKFDQAKADFERAIDLYTQAKGLFDNEMVAQRIGQIHQADLCRLAMQEYAVALASQDLSGQIAALRAAIAVRPIEPFMEKLSLAQAEQAYQQGQTHRIAGGIANLEKAVSAFKESLVYASSDKVKVALAEAETELKRARLIADGDAMMQAKRFLEAVELYEQAVAVGGVDQLAGKLADARIQMHFAAGETSRVSKRWGEALQAYERARQETPGDEALAARVQWQSELIAKEKSYYEYLDAGQALMRDKRYQDAAKKFARAEALAGELSVPAGEAAKWHSQADYALQLERGKAAQKAGNLTEALAYYRMAQRAMDTEEIRNLIAAIEAAKKQ